MEDLTPVKRDKNGAELAPCGRPSFSANAVNKKYNSRYRNELNQNRLGGKLLELGKAPGIVAFVLYGFDVSLEAAHSADRIRIFKSAAWYALTDEELEEIFQHSEAEVDFYIKGLVTAGIRLWKYEAPEEVECLIVLSCLMILSDLIIIFCAFCRQGNCSNLKYLHRWSRLHCFKSISLLLLGSVSSPSKTTFLVLLVYNTYFTYMYYASYPAEIT